MNGIKQTWYLRTIQHQMVLQNDSCNLKQKPGETSVTKEGNLSISNRFANFLFAYRNTPHTVTGVTPASLFLKYSLRTKLSLVHPNLVETVESKQRQQKHYHDTSISQLREFTKGEKVLVKNCSEHPGNGIKERMKKVLG